MSSAKFFFRVELSSKAEDDVRVETWYHGIDISGPSTRSISDWVRDSFSELPQYPDDWWEVFELDPNKNWQIVGQAKIQGHTNYWGEYDEHIDILECEKAEVVEVKP
jgi:hypothetical protein